MSEIRQLLTLMRPWTGWILLGTLLSLITNLANVTLMSISGWFIASMAMAGLAGVTMNYFTPAATIRAMAIIRTVGRYTERLVTHEATLKLVAHMRRWFYDRLEPLAPARLQDHKSGDIFSRIGADISVLENFYLRVLSPVLVAIFAIPIFLVFAGTFSATLATALLLLYLLAGLLVPLSIRHFGKQDSEAQVLKAAQMRATLVEGQQALREMIVYGRTTDYASEISSQSSDLRQSQRRLARLQSATQGTIALSANCAMFVTLLTIIPQVQTGLLSGPILPMLLLFALASFEVVVPLPLAMQSLIETKAAAFRLFSLVKTDKVTQPIAASSKSPEIKCPDQIAIRNATLRYPDTAQPAFANFSLSIAKGEKIAIVGKSGSGKSSLINALVGFWPLTEGAIEVDGKSASDLAPEQHRGLFAVAPQKPHMFNSTLRANLRVANIDASDEEMEQVLDLVQLSGFIATLPKGLDTFIGEAGDSLSGGQIRRMAIARALLSPSPVLILDEPGEGLDPQMERKILDRIMKENPDRTILLITHNKAGLEAMSRIIEMQLPDQAGQQ